MLWSDFLCPPRNKELFIGYPALVLWYVVRRMDIWPNYREALRLASVFAFASALNSFCHFHTPLFFTLWRLETVSGPGFFSARSWRRCSAGLFSPVAVRPGAFFE
jgi:hypothetical protein